MKKEGGLVEGKGKGRTNPRFPTKRVGLGGFFCLARTAWTVRDLVFPSGRAVEAAVTGREEKSDPSLIRRARPSTRFSGRS
jgi:hypothetical protein